MKAYPSCHKILELSGHGRRSLCLQIVCELVDPIQDWCVLCLEVMHVKPGPNGIDHPVKLSVIVSRYTTRKAELA